MSALPRPRQLVALAGTLAVVVAGFVAPVAAQAAPSDGVTVTAEVPPSSINLTGTVRDFEYGGQPPVCSHPADNLTNPDFEENDGKGGDDHGITTDVLGTDGTPVYAGNPTTGTASTHSAASFAQWYHDVDGMNARVPDVPITLTLGTDGLYHYASDAFFPIDHDGWAAASCSSPQLFNGHNYSFTFQLHTTFTYQLHQTFAFAGDDDVWVYLNDYKVIDLGGLHPTESASVSLDSIASAANMIPGKTYSFDLFFAERHTTASSFAMDTSITLDPALSASNLHVTPLKTAVAPGASDVPIEAIPPTAYPLQTQDAVASAPVRSVPVRSVPVRSVPVRSVPVRSVPVRSVPVRSVPLDTVLLSQIPLVGTTWQQQLAGTTLDGADLTMVTLVQALDALQAAGKPGPTLGQMDLSQTPLRDMTLASIFLGGATLNDLPITPPPGADVNNTNFDNWCLWFKQQGADVCATQPLTSSTSTLLSADLVGAPVRSVPVRSVPVRSVPADAPVRSVNLSDIGELAQTPVGQVPLNEIVLKDSNGNDTDFGAIPLSTLHSGDGLLGLRINTTNLSGDACDTTSTGCTTLGAVLGSGTLTKLSDLASVPGLAHMQLSDLGSALTGLTIGDLIDDLAPDYPMTFGDVLVSIVPAQTVDWESTPLDPLQLPRYDGTPGTVTYRVSLDLTGTPFTADGTVQLTLPEGFRFAGKASGLNGDESISVDSHNVVTITFKGRTVPSSPTVSFDVNPGLTLGDYSVSGVTATFTGAGLTAQASSSDTATVTVADTGGNDTPGDAQIVQPDHLVIGHISAPGEIDYYRLPVPPSGTHVHVLLSHLPTDDDLVIYGPSNASVSSAPVRSVPVRSVPLLDDGIDSGSGAASTTPQLLNDIPLLPGRQELGQSNHRSTDGEEVDTLSATDGSYYTIQVTGYNGAWSNSPYLLRVVEDAPTPVNCTTAGLADESQQGSLPAGSSATRSLFLVNVQQMEAEYPDTSTTTPTADLMSQLRDFAGRDDVAGLVVPIDADPGVVGAYNTWNHSPCDPAAADNVVDTVNALVRQYKSGSAPNLTSVVLVGSDRQLPMRRLTDLTLSSNENGYAESDSVGPNSDNPLSAAQKNGDLLSDDPYGSLAPVGWLDRRLYLPDLAVGRLVETPAEIEGQLAQFVTAGGALTPSSAFTSGYDFLADGAHAVDSALGHDVSGTHSTLIDDPGSTAPAWTGSQLLANLFPSSGESPFIDSINAHFDHNRLLPSAGNAGTSSTLVTVNDVTSHTGRIPGRVLFSMGCHAGLNVPDDYVGPGTVMARDWAQTFADEKAIWVANTGYGLGDTASVALSEEIMRLFAQRLDGSMTAGQALQFAKQAYFGELGAYGVYDEKALEEPVFYGLPMWRVGGARWDPPAAGGTAAPVPGPVNPPAPPSNPTAAHVTSSNTTDSLSGLAATDVTINPTFTQTAVPGRGTYWSIGGEVQDTHYRPIQPRTSALLPGNVPAHGALITALSSQDFTGTDPVFGRPTIDLSANEPEASAPGTTFPSQFDTLTSFSTPTGDTQRLVMIAGQFFSSKTHTTGTQRLFTTMTSRVLFSSSSNYAPPTLTNATSSLSGSGVTFTVDVTPAGGDNVTQVLVLYHTAGTTQWQPVNLVHGTGNTWSVTVPGITEAVEWFAQGVSSSGTVGITDDKGQMFGSQTGFKATISGTVGTNGWYTSLPTVDADGPAASYDLLVDGNDVGSVLATVPSGGAHTLVVKGSDGTEHSLGTINVDISPPTATFASPIPTVFQLGADGHYTVNCVDDHSGVVDCPAGGVVDTTKVGGGTVTFTIHDGAGNAATISLPYTVAATFAGFSPPVNDPYSPTTMSVFKYSSTIPLKFQLKSSTGSLLSDTAAQAIANACGAKLSFAKTGSTTLPADETVYSDAADSNGCFRYDATAHQFIYNLGTKSLPGGGSGQIWALRALVSYNGGVIADHAVAVGLK